MFAISKCCAGVKCRYNGNGYLRKIFQEKSRVEDHVAICPEMLGGLPCPREGCSVVDGRVIGRKTGREYTAEYLAGAQRALEICRANGVDRAYLLRGSPSCGKGYGIAAKLLEAHGIEVIAI